LHSAKREIEMSSDDAQALLKAILAKESSGEERGKAVDALAGLVTAKRTTLNWMVEVLGAQLTSDDDRERNTGTRALVDVLARCAADIGPASSRVFAAFFAERAEDVACQPEIIRGLHALCCSPGAGMDDSAAAAATIVAGLTAHFAPGTLSPESRRMAIDVLTVCVVRASTAGSAAVALAMRLRGAFVGERDTRVLRGAFGLVARLCRAAGPPEIAPHARELFDSFSAYFPVLFVPRPAPGTPQEQVVSKEELVMALRLCFASSPAFAALAAPFLLDKTASSISASRVDAFLTLAAVVRANGIDACGGLEFAEKVREALESNGLSSDGEAAYEAVGAAAVAVLELLPGTHASAWLMRLAEKCAAVTAQPENAEADFDKEASDSARHLLSHLVAHDVGIECAPKVAADLARYRAARPAAVVPTMADLAVAIRSAPPAAKTPVIVSEVAAIVSKELLSALSASTAVMADVGRGLAGLADLAPFPDSEMAQGVVALAAIAADKARPATARMDASAGLAGIAAHRPAIVVEKALPTLLAAAVTDPTSIRSLPTLAASHGVLFRGIVAQLVDAVVQQMTSAGASDSLLGALRDSVREGKKDEAESQALCHKTAIRLAETLCALPSPPQPAVITACRIIVRSIVETAQPQDQVEIVHKLAKLFIVDGAVPAQLAAVSPLFSAAVASVGRKSATAVVDLIPPLMHLAVVEAGKMPDVSRDAVALAVASVLNKLPPDN
jgi:hypothetical protein